MTAKRLLSVLIVLAMLAAVFGGCSSSGKKEETIKSPPVSEGGEAAVGSEQQMVYQSEKLSPPEDYQKMKYFAPVGKMLYLSEGQKLYTMDINGDSLEEVSVYTPLEGYKIAALGTTYGGGLLVLEQSETGSIVSFVSEDGTVDSVVDISTVAGQYNSFAVQKLFSDRDGNIYVQTHDGAMVISPDGASSNNIKLEINSEVVDIALAANGAAYVLVHERLNTVYAVYGLNPDGTPGSFLYEKPEETVLIPQLDNGGESFGLFYNDGEELFAIDKESGKAELLFSWDNHSLIGSFAYDAWDMTGREILCRYYTDLYIFRESMEPERTVLRLAVYQENYLLTYLVNDFNKTSDKYKVVVEDYAKYDKASPGVGLTKLNADLQTGNIPDIIDLSNIPGAEAYEKKGLFVDLYPLIDGDFEIERSDLFQPYLKAFERNGALYRALMYFSLFCFIGKSSVVGTDYNWTLDEMLSIQEQYTSDAPGMGGHDQGSGGAVLSGRRLRRVYKLGERHLQF